MAKEELNSLLERAEREYRAGITAQGRGDVSAAREHFLAAADKLSLAASASHGSLRESRKRLALELLEEARALKRLPPRAPSRRTTKPLSVGDKPGADSWLVSERPEVSFDDIAGLEEVKEQIRLKLLYPFTHPDLAERYGINPGGGILLYGPPGTGKTLIARAVAGEIDATFFAIKPSEVMSQWVGKAEKNLARLFAEASSYPLSVIFIDEMEALSPKRRSTHSTVMKRLVPQLLAELQGFHERENVLLLIGATNEPWEIDSAVLRPGRLDRLIYVPPPDWEARRRILELNLVEVPLAEDVSLDETAARTDGFSGADMAALAHRVRERVFTEAVHQGVARSIGASDFQAVLADMHPSIPTADLRLFERFKAGR